MSIDLTSEVPSAPSQGDVTWSQEEDFAFVECLREQKRLGKQADSGWHPDAYKAAARHLEQFCRQGQPRKSEPKLKSRWQRVKSLISQSQIAHLTPHSSNRITKQ